MASDPNALPTAAASPAATGGAKSDPSAPRSAAVVGPLLHELRTPLNAIFGFAQLLEIDARLDEEQRDNVQEILGAARRMLELLERTAREVR